MYKNILVALEGRATDEAAVAHASILAHQVSAQITLLRVITVMADDPGGLGKQFQIELGSSGWRQKNRAEATLAQFESGLRSGGLVVQSALIVGDRSEADEIVDYAEKGGHDLIVMAADRRSWWQRKVFGCPGDGVQQKSHLPTLFVSDGSRKERVVQREEVAIHQTMAMFGSASL